jgi:hypothetical protein
MKVLATPVGKYRFNKGVADFIKKILEKRERRQTPERSTGHMLLLAFANAMLL